MFFLYLLLLAAGFIALIKGADIFVDGSSALAKIFKVPGVIIGLTVVALGTSLPELAVSTVAAIEGSNEIALSNVLGSNIFNLLMVLGICAVIHKVPVDSVILKRDFPISIIPLIFVFAVTSLKTVTGGSFLSMNMADISGNIERYTGITLLVFFILYILYLIHDARKHPVQEEEVKTLPLWKTIVFIIAGAALIIAGGQAVVISAKYIAKAFGMTETLIGLTVVALGTSLPELVTSIVAARKGETSLAVGNVVGSNIFNLLFILGVSTSIHPVSVNAASVYDMAILFAVSIMTWIFSATGKTVNRAEGALMVLAYAGTAVFAVLR